MNLDIDDWFRGLRHWSTFTELVAELPEDSHYTRAVQGDDELARATVARGLAPAGGGVYRPPLSQWTAWKNELADIKDLLKLIQAGLGGGDFKPTVRPQTAMQRVERKQLRERVNVLDNLLLKDD